MSQPRRNLVVVRAGDGSLHPGWLPADGVRSWDLVVSYFGDDPARFRAPDVRRIDGKGPKWQGLARLFAAHPELLARYDYIWLPDDDVAARPAAVERIFALMRQYDLLLAQPALLARSHFNWAITLRNPACVLRWTSFVEVMLPCFAAPLLREVLPHFVPYVSGSGHDWVWPALANRDGPRAAVLDAAAVVHTRPFGGPNYRFLEGLPYDAADETAHVLATHGIADRTPRVFALVPRGGGRIAADGWMGRAVLRAGYWMAIAGAYAVREPHRWQVHAMLKRHMARPEVLADPHGVGDAGKFRAG